MNVKYKLVFLFALIVMNAVNTSEIYARQPDDNTVRLKNIAIMPSPNAVQWFAAKSKMTEPIQVLLHLNQLPGIKDRELLAQNDIQLLDYIDGKTYTAIISSDKNRKQAIPAIIYGITDILPQWKIGDELKNKSTSKGKQIAVIVSCYDIIKKEEIKTYITQLGGTIESQRTGSRKHMQGTAAGRAA